MITPIPKQNILPANARGVGDTSWKQGDIMRGRVVGSGKGNSIVSIGGNNYWLNSPLQFSQGESLMLRVAGLTPIVHFSLINRIRKNVGYSEVVSMSPAEKLLQGLSVPSRNLNSQLTSLINLLHFGSNHALPQASLQLIESLRRRLLQSGALKNPGQIRHSVVTASLVSTGGGASASPAAVDGGLQSLLHQIVDSLATHRAAVGKFPVPGNYQQALGLSQYQSGEGDLLRSFTRSVEEQYLNLRNSKAQPQDEMQQHPYRLHVELPVVFKDHIRSISIRIAANEQGGEKDSDNDSCSAEFELELLDCGWVYARISILGIGVSYQIGCENERVATHLRRSEQSIVEALDAYGLRLHGFRCEVRSEHLLPEPTPMQNRHSRHPDQNIVGAERPSPAATDEALRRTMREAHQRGQVPELTEFDLRLDNQPVAVGTEIPIKLYCAMAGLFVQLLEVDRR